MSDVALTLSQREPEVSALFLPEPAGSTAGVGGPAS
jgi:hypothetical protein